MFDSGAPAARRAAKRSPTTIGTGSHALCMHRNRNPCNSFLMVKMASGMDHGRVGPTTTTTTTNDVAQHGGHPANTKSCSLGLMHRNRNPCNSFLMVKMAAYSVYL